MDEGETPQDEPNDLVNESGVVDLDEPGVIAEIDQDRQAAIDAVRSAECVSVAWVDSELERSHSWLISPIELAPGLILFAMAKAWVDFKNLTGADDGDIARALRAALDEGVGQ